MTARSWMELRRGGPRAVPWLSLPVPSLWELLLRLRVHSLGNGTDR